MTHPYFCDLDNRETRDIAPGVTIRTFWQANMLLSVMDMEPGSVVTAHSHPQEQSGAVVWGEMEITAAGQKRLLKAGDCYIIPGDVEHIAVAGDAPVRAVAIFAPIRESYQY